MPTTDRLTWQDVAAEERAAIEERTGPVNGAGLIGVALSGGGLRSTAFALGVLEALKDAGVLSKVHYLSTVSAGSYIGGWLSAASARRPGFIDPAADWGRSIRYLRRHSPSVLP